MRSLAIELAGSLPRPFQLGGGSLSSSRAMHSAQDSLQAQLDALEAGLLAPIGSASTAGGEALGSDDSSPPPERVPPGCVGHWGGLSITSAQLSSGDLHGDETLSLFADTRMPQVCVRRVTSMPRVTRVRRLSRYATHASPLSHASLARVSLCSPTPLARRAAPRLWIALRCRRAEELPWGRGRRTRRAGGRGDAHR